MILIIRGAIKVELVLLNGKIATVDVDDSIVEAVAFKCSGIVYQRRRRERL